MTASTGMKQFTTAAKERSGENVLGQITFEHDGRQVTATKPKDGQLAMLMASVSGYSSEGEQAKGTIDFFINMFERIDDKIYWRDRLLSSGDDFDLEDLEEVLYWLVEEFTQRPTKPSSGSTSPQQTSGTASTENSDFAASTSSGSAPEIPAI